ncbi:MAG: mechanosensitive ion channel family protein [Candidatus Promineifilaceae bacterium]
MTALSVDSVRIILLYGGIVVAGTLLVRWLLLRFVPPFLDRHSPLWAGILQKWPVLRRLYLATPGILVAVISQIAPIENQSLERLLFRSAVAFSIIMLTGAAISALFAYADYYEQHFEFANQVPIKTVVQVTAVVLVVMALVGIVAIWLGVPLLAMAGLVAAIGAIAYYLFQEPLLGFTASLQLSMNRMVAIGDWIEIDAYDVDGWVEDINVTSTKVRNRDNAIVNVPTYDLIRQPFLNWHDMQDRQARRVRRAIVLDQLSIRFMDREAAEPLIEQIEELYEKLAQDVRRIEGLQGLTPQALRQRERLTNLELFMAYATCVIANHPDTRTDQMMYVRQEAPSAYGLPVDLYFFTHVTEFIPYYAVQRDIFSVLLAALAQFDLRAYQVVQGEAPASK